MRIRWTLPLLSAAALLLAACGGAAAPTTAPSTSPPATTAPPTDDPAAQQEQPTPTAETAVDDASAQAVEAYLTAKVAGDRDAMAQLLCSSMEARLDAEALSFNAVEASIEGMRCTANADGATVSCEGEIVAVYGGENRSFPLGRYSVVEEDGAWKWCGEAAGP